MPIILGLSEPATPSWNVVVLILLWIFQFLICLIMGSISLLGIALIYGDVDTFTIDVIILCVLFFGYIATFLTLPYEMYLYYRRRLCTKHYCRMQMVKVYWPVGLMVFWFICVLVSGKMEDSASIFVWAWVPWVPFIAAWYYGKKVEKDYRESLYRED
ncbi:hypothetical protein B0J14DRAFT_651610 [Halenospora varia]|nr:hypothetical protein B0J14DRAFT_651610 [Halenospora varia]